MQGKNKIMTRTSWISVFGNAFLSLLKIIIGLISGSLAVLSDGLDSASDVVTSIIILITSSIMVLPPDSKYAYGREKAENMASTILSFVILFMGGQMGLTAIKELIHPGEVQMPETIAVAATVISIVGKLLLALYQFQQGKRVDSSMLKANAINMRNDVIISVGVLIGLGFTFCLKLPILDPVVALLVSLYIIYSAIGIFRDANIVLMDGMSDISVYKAIIQSVERVPGATNPHRIRSSHVGNLYNIVLDIEADGNITLTEAHHIAQEVEESIKSSIENIYDIVVHVEPQGNLHCQEKYGINKDNLNSRSHE
ncbi:MAG: cation diffusion facilitator family transporter [Dysgonamonadaceae bacterium]|jgi:cation diffusion facilitator family transporter|nr:cation diffusion facilitator family transporter [Dysgonamonadaceae bacterium]